MTLALRALPLVLCAWSVLAQDALVTGRVQHSSGTPVAGVGVWLIDDATGVRRMSLTNGAGYYAIAGAESGMYNITVRRTGFQTTSRMGIKLDVGQVARIDFTIEIGTVTDTVSVEGGRTLVATEEASVSTVVGRSFFEALPLNGRGLLTLLDTAPGVLITPAGSVQGESGQFSVNGQRASANRILVDGIPIDSGPAYSLGPDPGATGITPGLSVIGSMQNLVSTEALEEFRLETSGAGVEMGRGAGGQLMLSTRSGTNQFHGALFDYLRNDKLNANDWFANRSGLPRAAMRTNDFGGTLGGALKRNRTFFFASFEGLRLDEPTTETTPVPSTFARVFATPRVAAFFSGFPLPNGFSLGQNLAAYTANVPKLADVDTSALRLDHTFNAHTHSFARFSHAPSSRASQGATTTSDIGLSVDSLTLGVGVGFGALSNDFRGNLSRFSATVASTLQVPSGEQPLDLHLFVPVALAADSGYTVGVFNPGITWGGTFARKRRQLQEYAADTLMFQRGSHQVAAGGDYRRLRADFRQNPLSAEVYYRDLAALERGEITQLTLTRSTPVAALVHNASLFVQDQWRVNAGLTLTAGVRWEFGPPPVAAGGPPLLTLVGWPDPSLLKFAPAGTPLWKTSYRNLAPRIGAVIKLDRSGSLVLRTSAGIFFDTGLAMALNNLTTVPPYSSVVTYYDATAFDPPSDFSPENGIPAREAALGYAPDFRMPRSLGWNVALERAFGPGTAASLTYVGASDSALLRSQYIPTDNGLFHAVEFAAQIDNGGHASYHSMQAQLRRRLSGGLQAILSYTWAHSIDNASKDGALLAAVTALGFVANPRLDRGNSDFDARQSFTSAFTWSPAWFHRWTLSGTARAHTGFPVDVESYVLYQGGLPYVSYQLTQRPDYNGAPAWMADANVGGGRRLNAAAFSQAPAAEAQGTLGRNAVIGFGMYQADLAAAREFRLREGVRLEFRAEAFNISNHPNFANPVCCTSLIAAPALGQSLRMLNNALGSGSPADGLDPVFQVGGPRSVQVGLRLRF